MAVSLLSMTKDEATVAEGVTVYKRDVVEKQYAAMKIQMEKDQKRLPELRKELEDIQQRIEANGYTLDLFEALIKEFDKSYPKSAEQEKQEPVRPEVSMGAKDGVKISEIPEEQAGVAEEDVPGPQAEDET